MPTKKIDPNQKASADAGIYGLPFTEKESKVIFIPVSWDMTTSYKPGTSKGPNAILKASEQIDFFDLDFVDCFDQGLFMQKESVQIKKMNLEGRKLAIKIINATEDEVLKKKVLKDALKKVNLMSDKLNEMIYKETKRLLKLNKVPVIVGGDHSTPFGAIKAYSEEFSNFGILHFDAHSDTRDKYMGFNHSHASIMRNVMEQLPGVSKLVQVGIRDFCEDEFNFTKNHKKIDVYFDQQIKSRQLNGEIFNKIAKEIVSKLPENIYISFDIDGLDPRFCPNTGTPVPGGLEYFEVMAIIKEISESGKTLVGFDVVEVAPNLNNKSDEWDANVGMRLIYKLTGASLKTKGLIEGRNL
jgi:agmatinase